MSDRGKVISFFKEDEWCLDILQEVQQLNLPDWWVCAGFVRTKIWDVLHGFYEWTPLDNIDVIFFDEDRLEEKYEKAYERRLSELLPGVPWSVKNEARMHHINGMKPYKSSVDAISRFPETATAIGLNLNDWDEIELAAPWGVEDALSMQVRPVPYFCKDQKLASIYENRILKKNWQEKWR
ncbi:nucleotidyltransferase family protein [Falsibacillus albus]|uniref:Nucleotidyltransferase family protein n=1 Tax=Falsibacillus albus TaxID=2478915 RepID=A0A3L7JVJ1_9BACI|nr:nucleotidyltransferase family protein [Falsibacillus albus]RLQ94325.1 nucleotidyltransferase family protein [Falsibacillus albus]